MTETSKSILITEANNGVGLAAAKALLDIDETYRLILAAHTIEEANSAKSEVLEACSGVDPSHIVPMQCALESLKSVKVFATKLKLTLTDGLDVVCINSGIGPEKDEKEPQFTQDGLELTLARNYFGPFLLVNQVKEMINAEGRVVIMSSDVQNNKKGKLPSFKNFAGMQDEYGKLRKTFVTIDGSDFDSTRAYATSMLCAVTFTVELDRRLELDGNGVIATCFCPGTSHMKSKMFGKKKANFEWAGGALAFMADDDSAGQMGGVYWQIRSGCSRKVDRIEFDMEPHEVNPEAANEKNQQLLWKLSAGVVRVEQD